MRTHLFFLFQLLFSFTGFTQPVINRQQFFVEDSPIQVVITTDLKNLIKEKKVVAWQAADIQMKFSDTLVIKESIRLQPRGEYRKFNCEIASLMLDFKNTTSPRLAPLKKLKLVGGCSSSLKDEELLLKEYLCYKILNHLTNMSFRVRLLHVTYNDIKKNIKPYEQCAFLIEDAKDMADRNNCQEKKWTNFNTEATNRKQMTLINLFQYMIGNTDWAVSKLHNIKLIVPKNDTLERPYVVPYDFDYCGLVDAPYAVPPEVFGTNSVRDRVFTGFARTAEELNEAVLVFNEKKSQIMYMLKNFSLLSNRSKVMVEDYIEDFYKIITNTKKLHSVFIRDARTE